MAINCQLIGNIIMDLFSARYSSQVQLIVFNEVVDHVHRSVLRVPRMPVLNPGG
jgi:hypothetical protein